MGRSRKNWGNERLTGNLYIIRNDVNEKVYVGKTYQSIEKRFKEHKRAAREGKPYKLYNAMRKYGIDKFHIELLGIFEKGVLEEKEIEYIAKYDSYYNGYNSTLGGDGGRTIELDIFNSVMFDLDYNRLKVFSNRCEIENYINSSENQLHPAWSGRLKDAIENDTIFLGCKWARRSDLLYDNKEFNTIYDKKQYLAGKECISINGLWFAKERDGFELNTLDGKLKCTTRMVDKIPTKAELEELVHMSIEDIAKIFNSSKTTVSRWYKSYGISRKVIIPPAPPREEIDKPNLSILDIMNKFKVSKNIANEWLIEYGITIDKEDIPTSKRPSKAVLEELKHLPKTQIAKMYGVSDKTIKKWFNKYGITDTFVKKFSIPSKEELEKNAYMSTAELMKLYNVSKTTLLKWFRDYGIKNATQAYSHERQEICPSREELESMKHLSCREISKKYGVAHTTVSRWFKNYGIEH